MPSAPQFRDLLGVIARASDIAMGLPEDHGARAALAAQRVAELVGASPRDTRDAVYVTLLRFAGCTADSHVSAHVMGDEIAVRGAMYGRAHFAEGREMLTFVWEFSGSEGRGLPGQLAQFARIMARIPGLMQSALAHCEVNDIVAEHLGLDSACRRALAEVFETWNGQGVPHKLGGEAISLPARIAAVADEVEAAHRLLGAAGVRAIVERRSGRALDPKLAALVAARAQEMAEALAKPAQSALAQISLADEPAVDEATLDALCEALADFADLKCAHTHGHSSAVARLSLTAATLLRVPSDVRACLRRAALVHDVGRVSVNFATWEKPGPLDALEWDRVHLHTLATERIIASCPALAKEAELAALAHERLDGSGYHRRLPPGALPVAARVLAAADVFQALCSARPHRAALSTARALSVLRDEVRAGRLDGEATEAVIAAAGERPRVAANAPRGLTERELDVLRLLGQGLSNRAIAQALGISAKTAGNHVQNVFGKIGVTSRAAAAMFAMRAGLLS